MKCLRQRFYDFFSHYYDGFVRAHSGDEGQVTRRFFIECMGPRPGERLMDLCTGTGDVALGMAQSLRGSGHVQGLDFSRGMLRQARQKQMARTIFAINWVQADAAHLPIRDPSLNGVSCSHALYELKGLQRIKAMEEVARVLIPEGRFCLMEHATPSAPIKRFLLRLRCVWTGGFGTVREISERVTRIKEEEHFLAPGGKSWVTILTRVKEGDQ